MLPDKSCLAFWCFNLISNYISVCHTDRTAFQASTSSSQAHKSALLPQPAPFSCRNSVQCNQQRLVGHVSLSGVFTLLKGPWTSSGSEPQYSYADWSSNQGCNNSPLAHTSYFSGLHHLGGWPPGSGKERTILKTGIASLFAFSASLTILLLRGQL